MRRLRELRQARGLSQKAVAERVGISRTAVAQYEAGSRVPAGDILVRLSQVLGIRSSYLLELSDDPEREDNLPPEWEQVFEEAMAEGFTAEDVRRILRAFREAMGKGSDSPSHK